MSVLVVATILEGKQFPSKPKCQLHVTCKFAGELLNSDPVPHTSAPYFNTELAWELTRKTLHQHRLQRTPLKLAFYSRNTSAPEEVGHIMLDLRSISASSPEYKWYPLARSKYKTHKPQIRLMLTTEDADENEQTEAEPAAPKKLFVSLDEVEGCYQVGAPSNTDPLYVLSLTVIAAANLIYIIDTTKPAAFCFRFNLLDNVVTNSSFVNAVNPAFPIERVSVKLRGSLENIYKYLASVTPVSLQLCQGSDVVGVVELPFTRLLTAGEGEEGCVNSLHSCLNLKHPVQGDVMGESRPSVEVHFTLKEDGKQQGNTSDNTDEMLAPSNTNLHNIESVPQVLSYESPEPRREMRPVSPARREMRPVSPAISPPSSPTAAAASLYRAQPVECSIWSCHIQLSNAKLNRSGKRYIRYVYPFFGTSAPHATSVIKFIAGDATPLPPSSCEYSFAADTGAVEQQFSKVPLVLQFWSKSPDSDFLEGTSVLSLSPLLKPGLQHMFGKVISKSDETVIGDVQISGWLEEKGRAPKHAITEPTHRQQQVETPDSEPVPERERPEYKAALELELWKELQQEQFLKELDVRAEARMKQIASEWKRKETEREDAVRKQVVEYNKLKDKMKSALKDLEIRECNLLDHERKLLLSQEDLTRERARLTSDVRETSRRTEEQFEHKLRLEKQKLAMLERQNKELKTQVEEAEVRLEKRTAELGAARETQLTAPSTRIQTQLEILSMEKEEMERKIGSLEKAKLHYKDSWTKALKELINVRERSQQDAKRRLHHEQSLMEHARLRYLSLEDNKLNDKLGGDVENLKNQINKMKDQIPQKEEILSSDIHKITLGRLIAERNSLLNTGVYNKHDPLIRELDQKISLLQQP